MGPIEAFKQWRSDKAAASIAERYSQLVRKYHEIGQGYESAIDRKDDFTYGVLVTAQEALISEMRTTVLVYCHSRQIYRPSTMNSHYKQDRLRRSLQIMKFHNPDQAYEYSIGYLQRVFSVEARLEDAAKTNPVTYRLVADYYRRLFLGIIDADKVVYDEYVLHIVDMSTLTDTSLSDRSSFILSAIFNVHGD